LQLSRSRSNRQFMQTSASTSALPATARSGTGGDLSGRKSNGSDAGGGKRQTKHAVTALTNVFERPATRLEIEALGAELQERIKAVLEDTGAASTNVMAYEPHKDAVSMIRDRMVLEFHTTAQEVQQEPWLRDLIRCECLRDVCDTTAMKLTDMLAVTSAEFGAVMRKLRNTYNQSHQQLRLGWAGLREEHVDVCAEMALVKEQNAHLEAALRHSEQDIRSKIDAEVFEMRESYEEERARDREHVLKTESQMAEMSVTLRDLNALFKTMQGDADAAIASDTMAHCRRLEKEVQDLENTVSVLAKTKEELHQEQKHGRHQEAVIKELRAEVEMLNSTVNRQDETLANLMGREAMHHAEIDKLKRMAAEQAEKEEDLEFDQTATALLCIKCKKSLDDLSNIRDAVLGSIKPTEKLMCQNFRILLPNLKGRRPSRDSVWVRKCMRGILMSKLREVCALMPLGLAGQVTGFPEFVYAWFEPVILPPSGALSVGGSSASKGSAASAAHLRADEDRWGFYYGVKAMSRENMEAKMLWSLLDEAQGEDGLAFVMTCLSVALSLGGNELWRQFGDASGCDSVNSMYFPDNMSKQTGAEAGAGAGAGSEASAAVAHKLPPTIWLKLEVAKQAVRLVLVRALEPQMHATMDAIEALKEAPDIENPLVPEEEEEALLGQHGAEEGEGGEGGEGGEDGEGGAASPAEKPRQPLPPGPEPTHIDMFVWLRILLQRFQEEQSHRGAAIRLMFDTSSIGALTAAPPPVSLGNNVTGTDYVGGAVSGSEGAVVASLGAGGAGGESHVEFPQFAAILKTLHPAISASESAALFGTCYAAGLRKVTANVFLKVAESRNLFSRSMRLVSLPLLRRKPDDSVDIPADIMVIAHEADKAAGAGAGAKAPAGEGAESKAAAAGESKGGAGSPAGSADAEAGPPAETPEQRARRLAKPVGVTVDDEQKVRKSLGAFVHSRSRMMEPEVRRMAKDLPERWRMVLLETYVDLNNAIVDNFAKIRATQRALNSADRNAGSASGGAEGDKLRAVQYYLDGVQPYLLYRKLLSFMLMFEGLCDNPLLPGDLLTSPSASSAAARRGFGTNANGGTGGISLHNARSIVFHIESALLGKRYPASKVARFEAIRRSVSARRIQHTFLRMAHDKELAVPAGLRNLMHAGYLTGRGRGPSDGRNPVQCGLRARKVYMEPWCAQAVVGEIFYFKIMYDRRAASVNLPALDLRRAVPAAHLSLWGCHELAELSMHDFCNAVKNYMHGLPRLRLFAAFLGFSDLSQPLAGMLGTPLATDTYLQLVLQIHKEVAAVELEEGNASTPTILFPCMENPLLRPDKRDFWKCDPEILLAAVRKWSLRQAPLVRPMYARLFDKLTGSTDRDGLMDVDDMLWACMQQWAKTMATYCKRVEDQTGRIRAANQAAFGLCPLPLAEPKGSDRGAAPLSVDSRRLAADLRHCSLPMYPADIAAAFGDYLDGSVPQGGGEGEGGGEALLADPMKVSLLAVNQVLAYPMGSVGAGEMLSIGTFADKHHHHHAEHKDDKAEKKGELAQLKPPAKLGLGAQGGGRAGAATHAADAAMSRYLQELMVWNISTDSAASAGRAAMAGLAASAGAGAGVATLQPGEAGAHSVDMFGSMEGSVAGRGEDAGSPGGCGDNLLQSLPIASAVSSTISMWHLVRLWSGLAGSVAAFLEAAGRSLAGRAEVCRDSAQAAKADKASSGAAMMSKLASFGGSDVGGGGGAGGAGLLSEYLDLLDDAAALSHSLHICCGTADPAKGSGKSALPRTSSTVVNPTSDYSEEATAEAWRQVRQLATVTSKLSVRYADILFD
jgi:hypothetical protein